MTPTSASHLVILAALALIFLVLSIFQAALNSLSRMLLARMREQAAAGFRAGLLKEASEPPPSRLRIGVQVGRQLCLIGAAVVASRLAGLMGSRHPLVAGLIAVALLFTVLIEQIAARALVLIDPQRAFKVTLPAVGLIHYPLIPLAWPLCGLLRWVQKTFRPRKDDAQPGEEEVRAFLDVGEEEGILEAEQGNLIESVIDFGDTLVREVMTPRTEMAAISESTSLEELVAFAAKTRHSRIPLYRGSIDQIVGVANTRDLFEHWNRTATTVKAGDFGRPVHIVPESKKVSELLRELQASRQQLAIVVDEYGGTAGLVTLEDLLEEIVGEIRDEHEPEDVMLQHDGSKVVRGRIDVVQAGELFDVDLEGEGFETIGGLVEARLGHIPEVGERVAWRGIVFEVTDVDRRRVRRVRMSREAPATAEQKAPRA